MIVFFDTVRRKRPVHEGGELVKLDWRKKRVLSVRKIFPENPTIENDPNPRGNSRGGKGILVTANEVFVGTYHTILVFDHNLNLLRTISNPLFVDIHEIALDQNDIWVSSTTIDAAIKVDQWGGGTGEFWPRENRKLQRELGLFPLAIDKSVDNRLLHLYSSLSEQPGHVHLNSVTKCGSRTYVFLNRLGTLIQIVPETKVIIQDLSLKGAHSPQIFDGGRRMWICGSFKRCLIEYDLHARKEIRRIELADFRLVRKWMKQYPDQPFNRSIFVRGLNIVDEHRLLVGVSPAAVLEVDALQSKLLDFFQYSQEVGDAVHGLAHC